MDTDLRMIREGREKKETQAPLLLFYSSPSPPPSLHGLPSNHLALIHDSSVYRCLCSLLSLFPSLLVAFFHCSEVSLTLSGLCTSCIIEGSSRRSLSGRKKGMVGGREKILVTQEHTGLGPLNGAESVHCTDSECVPGGLNKSLQSFLSQMRQSLFISPFLRVLHL